MLVECSVQFGMERQYSSKTHQTIGMLSPLALALALLKLAILCHAFPKVGACLDRERYALRTFRNALQDPTGLLSSWDHGEDCCKWRGVSCHSRTGCVTKLDLHADDAYNSSHLSGRIDPALLQLKHLQFLDLSYNNFSGSSIPSFFGSLKELRHLNLSRAGLSGRIPHQLGNLSNLVSLHLLSDSWSLSADNLWWITNMSSLQYLHMYEVDLSLATHKPWVHLIMRSCPSLVELRLEACALSFIPPFLSTINFTSLRVLDISENEFHSPFPNWIANITSLISLHLSLNMFRGRIPYHMSLLPYLEELSVGDRNDDLDPQWSVFSEGSWNNLKKLDLTLSHDGSIPESIGNISSLVSLILSVDDGATIPDDLGRLKNLEHLEIRNGLSGPIPASLGMLSSLKTLYLPSNQLNGTIPETLGGLSSLQVLDLQMNQLTGTIPETAGGLYSLEVLLLQGNQLSGPIPASLGGLSSLKILDLSTNQLNGTIPATLGGLSSIEQLFLPSNQLSGAIPETVGGLSSLRVLDLAGNQLSGKIPETVEGLSSLQTLDLRENRLTETIPETVGALSSLEGLYLEENKLSGEIPTALGKLSNLTELFLSDNFLTGNVSKSHLEKLRKLDRLALDGNPSLVLDLQPNWIPPFQLFLLNLESVRVGPQFPLWLRTQKRIGFLDISNASISGIIPNWLWSTVANVDFLSLSHNMLSGQLPCTLEMDHLAYLDFSWNFLNGSLPCISSPSLEAVDLSNNLFFGSMPMNCTYPRIFFSASGNRISGPLPTSISQLSSINFLDLSNNGLTGTIPETIGYFTSLVALDLSSNCLWGSIPTSMASLVDLNTLHLNSNGLSGELPSSLESCRNLVTLDLGDNKFSGKIPSWISEALTGLRILNLRGNLFTGGIPPQLFHPNSSLQVFDVACNGLSGPIPPTFEHLKAMKNDTHDHLEYKEFANWYGNKDARIYYRENMIISTKGQTLTYTTTLSLLTCIDLSSNNFSGEIPDALASLSGLNVLNLSGNHLIGNIPDNIGGMVRLESLDLSNNELSGIIPQSISSLYFLSSLNLSHNSLSGRIPSGKQLQALPDATIYSGNAGLCGFPLSDCGGNKRDGGRQDEKDDPADERDHQDETDDLMFCLYVGIAPGFVLGFWTFWGALILKKTWRTAFFHLVDDLTDKLYIFAMLWMARLKEKTANENGISGH